MTPCWGMLGSNSVSWKMAFQESRWRCRWMKPARQKNAMNRSFCTTWGRAVWAPLRPVKGAWGVAEFPVVLLVFRVFFQVRKGGAIWLTRRSGSLTRSPRIQKEVQRFQRFAGQNLSLWGTFAHLPRTKIVLQKHFKAYLPTFGWMGRWVIFYPQVRSLHWSNSPNSEIRDPRCNHFWMLVHFWISAV